MSMHVVKLRDGAKGFDCNTTITRQMADAFVKAGYQFAVRYVRRQQHHSYDLTAEEVNSILRSGLGLMPVQHVAAEGWVPRADDGALDGAIAAEEARSVGIPPGVSLWCDLEGVKHGTPHGDTIAFCNNWHEAVKSAGFAPGQYVGDSCGLTSVELYRNLRFDRYWGAYNLNADEYPATRGVCMQQRVATSSDREGIPAGLAFQVDYIHVDKLGGSPAVLLFR